MLSAGIPGTHPAAPRGWVWFHQVALAPPCTIWIFSSSVIWLSTKSARASGLAVGGGGPCCVGVELPPPPQAVNTDNSERVSTRPASLNRGLLNESRKLFSLPIGPAACLRQMRLQERRNSLIRIRDRVPFETVSLMRIDFYLIGHRLFLQQLLQVGGIAHRNYGVVLTMQDKHRRHRGHAVGGKLRHGSIHFDHCFDGRRRLRRRVAVFFFRQGQPNVAAERKPNQADAILLHPGLLCDEAGSIIQGTNVCDQLITVGRVRPVAARSLKIMRNKGNIAGASQGVDKASHARVHLYAASAVY